MSGDDQLKTWGNRKDKLFLPDKPLTIDFVMHPAGRVAGKLVDEQGRPLAGYSVALGGADLPPSSSVMASVYADAQGRVVPGDPPTTHPPHVEGPQAAPEPPGDGSL